MEVKLYPPDLRVPIKLKFVTDFVDPSPLSLLEFNPFVLGLFEAPSFNDKHMLLFFNEQKTTLIFANIYLFLCTFDEARIFLLFFLTDDDVLLIFLSFWIENSYLLEFYVDSWTFEEKGREVLGLLFYSFA